jgi:F-type H+-transporting ATPase subunit gamma
MAVPLKIIKNRIRSIQNTKKITGAMETISIAKLNRTDRALRAYRPYYEELEKLFYDVMSAVKEKNHPFFRKAAGTGRCILCVVTSDNGLCGQYNLNVFRAAEEFIRSKKTGSAKLFIIGKRGVTYFKSRMELVFKELVGINGNYSEAVCDKAGNDLLAEFIKGRVDEVYVAYTGFRKGVLQKALIERFLPFEEAPYAEKEYIAEPDINTLFDGLCEAVFKHKARYMIMQAITAEHAARGIAMHSANENADELIDDLTLLRNKVRQAAITQEIMEIISSSEALRG